MLPATHSHSSLSSYEKCPRQYRYRYIDRLSREMVGVEAHTGSSVHAALEQLHKQVLGGARVNACDLEGWYRSAWEKVPASRLRVVRRGFDAEDYWRLGWVCLQWFQKRFQPQNLGQVVSVEEKIKFRLDGTEGTAMVGIIDLLVRADDGSYEIHDYKTSGSWPWRRDLDRDRQLSLYEIGLRDRCPDAVHVRQFWHYLTLGRTFTRTRRQQDLERVRRETLAVIGRLGREKRYGVRTGILCHWCDFNTICREGREWMALNPAPGLPG